MGKKGEVKMCIHNCPICKDVKPMISKDDSVKGLSYEISLNARCPKCGTVVWLPEKKTEADLIALWNEYAEVVGCD